MSDYQLDPFDRTPSASAGNPEAPSGALAVLPFPANKRRRGAAASGSIKATVATFPQHRRHSKVRDVADKLLAKTTPRAVAHYRWQVSNAMSVHLRSRHVPVEQHGAQIRLFWIAVDCEVARRLNGGRRPGGAANV
jgi:hypothetical protein